MCLHFARRLALEGVHDCVAGDWAMRPAIRASIATAAVTSTTLAASPVTTTAITTASISATAVITGTVSASIAAAKHPDGHRLIQR